MAVPRWVAGAGFVLLSTATAAAAEPGDDPTAPVVPRLPGTAVRLGGTVQARTTYAVDRADETERLGFGVRRLRGRVYGDVGPRAGLFIQVEGASGELQLLDARFELRLSDHVLVKLGRFVVTQPLGYARTFHFDIDGVTRPATMVYWATHTIGADGRDFGLETVVEHEAISFQATVHNGWGSWDRAWNFREDVGVGSTTRETDRRGMAASVAVSYTPPRVAGLDVGGFTGVNFSRNDLTAHDSIGREYATYAGHLYWGSHPGAQRVRVKADLMAISYADARAAGTETHEQFVLGGSWFVAVSPFVATEVFGRVEYLDENLEAREDDVTRFASGGLSFSPSAFRGLSWRQERLTLGYTARFDRDLVATAHRVALQAQAAF